VQLESTQNHNQRNNSYWKPKLCFQLLLTNSNLKRLRHELCFYFLISSFICTVGSI